MSTYTITPSLARTLIKVTLPCGKVHTCICDSVESGVTVGGHAVPIAEMGWPSEVVNSIKDYFVVVQAKTWTVGVTA